MVFSAKLQLNLGLVVFSAELGLGLSLSLVMIIDGIYYLLVSHISLILAVMQKQP